MTRFLVIRLSSIGDVVHALPAVAALGEAFPGAGIDWAIEPRFAGLLDGNRYIRRVLKLDTLGWRRKLGSAATIEAFLRSAFALREVAYDAAIDFQGLWKSALIARLSRACERLGFAEYWLREPGAGAFYSERVAPRGRQHVIEMNLALVERLGARADRWQFPLPENPRDCEQVERRLADLGAQDFILLSPGGGWKAKRWAPENYSRLVGRLGQALPGRVLLTGSPDEEGLIEEILGGARTAKAAYFPSTISQFIALVRRARLFVGGDTGPLHLAAALGTPIVGLYGSADPLNTPERNGPFRAEDIVVSPRGLDDRPRWRKETGYLSGISVDDALDAIRRRLERAYG